MDQVAAWDELFLMSKEDERIVFIAGITSVLSSMTMTKGRDV